MNKKGKLSLIKKSIMFSIVEVFFIGVFVLLNILIKDLPFVGLKIVVFILTFLFCMILPIRVVIESAKDKR